MKKITIKKWNDLHHVKNDKYRIHVWSREIAVCEHKGPKFVASNIDIVIVDEETILRWFKLFGFDVEVEKQPKLTKQQREIVESFIRLKYVAIEKGCDAKLWAILENGRMHVVYQGIAILFNFMETGKQYMFEDMLTWEVSK